MSRFSDNIRYLRTQKGLSQEFVAQSLSIDRSRYATYETGRSEAPYEILMKLAQLHHVSIDLLLGVDMRKISMEKLLAMPDNRILLPITVDKEGESIIEIIPHQAKAGYLTGYRDPEFVESLQQLSLPFLRNGKFRAFPIDGDSMPPLPSGSFVVGEYVEQLKNIKSGQTYILLTKSEGIVYKRVAKTAKGFILNSDNPIYESYEIRSADILEVWKFKCAIVLTAPEPDNATDSSWKDMIVLMHKDVQSIKETVQRSR